jgi:hypothetical protein
MNKYQQGESLSEQDYKYLATTSELINENIDKIHMQKAINVIDKKLIY